MKSAVLATLLFFHSLRSAGQQSYWQQKLHYGIRVTLDDAKHTLDGDMVLRYVNNSPDTLRNIWFHLWPNAYKNDRTAFSEQMLQNGNTEFYFSDPEDRGYINGLDFRINGRVLRTEDHPSDIDILNVLLPSPLAPGDSITLSTPFHVKLPKNFSRGGHHGNQYSITQWYPKPAVYDRKGWHTMPYLDQGEYYAEFGTYDVRITVPEEYVVAATGMLQDSAERAWISQHTAVSNPKPITHNPKPNVKTLHFTQSDVHDFAWFADKDYIVVSDSIRLPGGRSVEARAYYHPAVREKWAHAMNDIRQAILLHSAWIGEYPYDVVSVVEGVQGNPSGMEYPTITFIHDLSDSADIRATIFHEVGHNWFQVALGSDERSHPWMDEGVNTFYDRRYLSMAPLPHRKYGSRMDDMKAELSAIDFRIREAAHLDQPITTAADSMHMLNYDAITYHKTAVWMKELERAVGRGDFDRTMQEYFRRWAFRHPYPDDLREAFRQTNAAVADTTFALLSRTGPLDMNQKLKPKILFGSVWKTDGQYRYTLLNPIAGYNLYDGLMPGLAVHNYSPPEARFMYAAAGMYGIGSKRFTGIGRFSYAMFPSGPFRRIDMFLSGAHFSMDRYRDSTGRTWFQAFTKIAPGIRLELRNKDMRSSLYRYLQYTVYSIHEDHLSFRRDSVTNMEIVGLKKDHFVLHQLMASWEDMRKLYPWRAEWKMEATRDIARISFTGKYFFNYRKRGGVDLRFFAGKFFHLGGNTPADPFLADRFALNMTGPKGYEDYSYSDYFFGRNAYEGINSQQIMERDGYFKVRTDLLGSKVGKTDDWLVAMNLVMDIPDRLNPLAALPMKIPLQIFADLGTQAGAWGRYGEGQRMLFDGGIAFHLFHSHMRVYVPLVYSAVYRDYFKSVPGNNFFQRISFSLDLRGDVLRKWMRQGFE